MLLIALSPSRAALMASLPLCVTAAAACDLRSRRIPNALTALTAFAGFVIALSGLGPASWQDGLVAGGISITVGMVLHAVRVIGGGDVKLFAASALWLGPSATVAAALATAICGGILALFFLRAHRLALPAPSLVGRLQLNSDADAPTVPYGLAVAIGCTWAWISLVLSAR
jgi:prepilin peptidase CpaA